MWRAPEADAQRELHGVRQIDLPGQSDVAVPGLSEFPIHLEIVHQVLPAVAESDVTDGALREIGRAAERHIDVLPLRVEKLPAIQSAPPSRVVFARALQVRCEQSIEPEFSTQLRVQDFQARVHQQNRRVRIDDDFLDEAIAALAVRVGEPIEQCVLLRVFDLMQQVAPFLVTERFAIGDEELEIAGVGQIHIRKIDLVHDAVTEREPNAGRAVIRRADAVLGAGRPARLDAWRSESGGAAIHRVLSIPTNGGSSRASSGLSGRWDGSLIFQTRPRV